MSEPLETFRQLVRFSRQYVQSMLCILCLLLIRFLLKGLTLLVCGVMSLSSVDASQGQEKGNGVMANTSDQGESLKMLRLFADPALGEHPARIRTHLRQGSGGQASNPPVNRLMQVVYLVGSS
jgi:hypothetical protein